MSTTRVPLLVTTGVDELPTELLPAGVDESATDVELPAAAEVVLVAVVELVVLHAASPTTNEAARALAVHLRMRI